jgi:hypothetical protein
MLIRGTSRLIPSEGHVNSTLFRGLKPRAPSGIPDLQLQYYDGIKLVRIPGASSRRIDFALTFSHRLPIRGHL